MADRWGDLAYALGGWSGRRDRRTNQSVDGAREKWKPNIKVLRAVIQYVKDTRRFQPKAVILGEAGVGEDVGVEEGVEIGGVVRETGVGVGVVEVAVARNEEVGSSL